MRLKANVLSAQELTLSTHHHPINNFQISIHSRVVSAGQTLNIEFNMMMEPIKNNMSCNGFGFGARRDDFSSTF
jgi:hypothetical protein